MSGSYGRKTFIAALALIGAALAFATWYRLHYSMGVAPAFEVAGSPAAAKVLIATQASPFKDAVTTSVVEHLRQRSATVKVIDVSGLNSVQPNDWDVIVVIHTWEMRKPPTEVQALVDRMQKLDELVVLTTSGAGNFKLAGVDAIAAASQIADVPARVQEITMRIDSILNRES